MARGLHPTSRFSMDAAANLLVAFSRFTHSMKFVVVSTILAQVTAFGVVKSPFATRTRLAVSTGNIGLGPAKDQKEGKKELVASVDYEVPNHEEYRTSRRSKLDEQCDKWFGSLLNASDGGVLGDLSDAARTILTTPVELKNEVSCHRNDFYECINDSSLNIAYLLYEIGAEGITRRSRVDSVRDYKIAVDAACSSVWPRRIWFTSSKTKC